MYLATGARVRDKIGGGETFEIKANKVIFAGGPFTDTMRDMENDVVKDESYKLEHGLGTISMILRNQS